MRDVDVFLFDEPLSNLDAKLRTELRVEIKRLHKQLGNTMIYVTHDQIEALTLADRIAVMKGGVIQQLDAPQEIYNRPVNLFVAGFIGSPAMNFLEGRTGYRQQRLRHHLPRRSQDRPRGLRVCVQRRTGRPPGRARRPARANHFNDRYRMQSTLPLRPDADRPDGRRQPACGASIGNETMSVRIGADDDHKIGERIEAFFQPKLASLFDAESGDRL